MAQITNLFKILNGIESDADIFNSNFSNIKSVYNEHDVATVNTHNLTTSSFASFNTINDLINLYNPISTILKVWRPSDITFSDNIDLTIYKQLDGSVIDDEGGYYHEVVVPNINNRYLIGVKDDEDVDAIPVGNSGNIVDFSHYHTETPHQHSSSNHNHYIGSHNHTLIGAVDFTIQEWYSGANFMTVTLKSSNTTIPGTNVPYTSLSSYVTYTNTGSPQFEEQRPSASGQTNAIRTDINTSGNAMTNNSNPVNANSTPNTTSTYTKVNQDIQPKSLKVQMYIRYK